MLRRFVAVAWVVSCGSRSELDAPHDSNVGSACPAVSNDANIALTLARGHSCALLADGTVDCWGIDFAQGTGMCPLGQTAVPCSTTPHAIAGVSGVKNLATGGGTTCAVEGSGSVVCWGVNTSGELGTGTSTQPSTCALTSLSCSRTPVVVSGLDNATMVSAGVAHVCAVRADGTVMCWGNNSLGALGIGDATGPQKCAASGLTNLTACSDTPVAVSGLHDVTTIAAGSDHTCALLRNGTVACWGANYGGQIGAGTGGGPEECANWKCSTLPIVVSGLSGVTAIAAGDDHTCALLSDATVRCWGGNYFGELGNGDSRSTDGCQLDYCVTKPVAVKGLTGVRAIAAGGHFTCALLCDGTVSCWGLNALGELGLGTSVGPEACHDNDNGGCSTTPVAVPNLAGVVAIAAGTGNETGAVLIPIGPQARGGSVCATLEGHTVECWGDDHFGALGLGTSTGPEMCAGDLVSPGPGAGPCSTIPVAVPGL